MGFKLGRTYRIKKKHQDDFMHTFKGGYFASDRNRPFKIDGETVTIEDNGCLFWHDESGRKYNLADPSEFKYCKRIDKEWKQGKKYILKENKIRKIFVCSSDGGSKNEIIGVVGTVRYATVNGARLDFENGRSAYFFNQERKSFKRV